MCIAPHSNQPGAPSGATCVVPLLRSLSKLLLPASINIPPLRGSSTITPLPGSATGLQLPTAYCILPSAYFFLPIPGIALE